MSAEGDEGAPNPVALGKQPMGAGQQALQKVSVLAAKAALNSIPWAALVFDLGQSAVDFANARLTDRLLEGLATRIDQLEAGARERLEADEIYRLSAQAAIRRMMTETNPRMADALARAVVQLGLSEDEPGERMQVVRALDILTEPSLHLLQTLYRLWHDNLTEPEIAAAGGHPGTLIGFNVLMTDSMQVLSWVAPTNDLQRMGMIANPSKEKGHISGGQYGNFDTGPHEVLHIGKEVIRLCFDDPATPVFGKFAAGG